MSSSVSSRLEGQLACAPAVQAPEEDSARSPLRDQAYEEYLALLNAGERVDPASFCERYPGCRSSLFRLLGMHQQMSRVADALPLPEALLPQPGDQLGDVTLVRELGRGAFARAFLATEASAGDRPVVVKLSYCGQGEAQTLGRLTHRNIVPILWCREDAGTGLTIVCMPFLGGATLEDVLDHLSIAGRRQADVLLQAATRMSRAGDPSVDIGAPHPRLLRGSFTAAVLHLALELAEALEFLHRRGICHRDLKPSNVLLAPDGSPRLLDFNLAAEHAGKRQILGGTLHYAAPEQIRAFLRLECDAPPPTERADLFSLAVVLHELLTGAHPFGPVPPGLPPEELGRRMLERQSRGCQRLTGATSGEGVADLDRPVAQLLDRCLAFDPALRPSSAAELIAGLRAYFQPSRRCRRWAARRRLVLAGGGLVLAIGIAWLSTRPTPYEAGRAAFRQGRYEEAERHFTALVASEPRNNGARFALGCVRIKQSRMAADRRQRLALLVAARGDMAPLAQDGDMLAHLCVAYCFAAAGEHAAAVRQAEDAEEAGFSSTALLNNRAFSHRLRGAWQEAERDLGRIPLKDQDLPEVAYNRAALALARHLGGTLPVVPSEALADARRAAEGSDHVDAHWLAARLHGLAASQGLPGAPPAALAADDPHLQQALTHLRRSLELGLSAKFLDTEPMCQALKGHPSFEALRAIPQPHLLPFLPPFGLLDPTPDSGDS
jgi:tetratricopeptide (TPR) repeat protein